jgi:hypothetical protein
MTETRTTDEQQPTGGAHEAKAFDIRVFIAALIGIYGVVLVLTGLFGTNDGDLAKAGGINVNLLAGLGMLAFSAAFLAWARMRPVIVPASEPEGSEEPDSRSSD